MFFANEITLGGRLLITIVLLWKVPNLLTSTDKLLGGLSSVKKVDRIFELQPYLVVHVTCTEKALRNKPRKILVIKNSAKI